MKLTKIIAFAFIAILVVVTGMFLGRTTIDDTGIHMQRPLTFFAWVLLIIVVIIEEER